MIPQYVQFLSYVCPCLQAPTANMNNWCMKWTVSHVTLASSVMKLGSPQCPGPAVRASSVWAMPHQPPPTTEPTDHVLWGITVRLVSSRIMVFSYCSCDLQTYMYICMMNRKTNSLLFFVAEIFLRLRLIFDRIIGWHFWFYLITTHLISLCKTNQNFIKKIWNKCWWFSSYLHNNFAGTTTAVQCPKGTYRNQTGAGIVDDCWPCRAGYYCDLLGMTGPTDLCSPRYYCPDTAKIESDSPSTHLCPAGFFCPRGTADPIGCDPGNKKLPSHMRYKKK